MDTQGTLAAGDMLAATVQWMNQTARSADTNAQAGSSEDPVRFEKEKRHGRQKH